MTKRIEVSHEGYDALCKCIEYYKGCNGTQVHNAENCALCLFHDGCSYCPINLYSGCSCDNTPVDEWLDERNHKDRTYIKAAIEQEEVRFLEKVKAACVVEERTHEQGDKFLGGNFNLILAVDYGRDRAGLVGIDNGISDDGFCRVGDTSKILLSEITSSPESYYYVKAWPKGGK